MRPVVLDSGPLDRIASDRTLRLRLEVLLRDGYYALVPAAVLAEAITGTRRDAPVHWAVNRMRVVATDRATAELAGRLRHGAHRAGATPSGVDAIVAAHAASVDGEAAVMTTDPDDLKALLVARPAVRVLTAS